MFTQVIAQVQQLHKNRENEAWNEYLWVAQFSFSHGYCQNEECKSKVDMNCITTHVKETSDDNFEILIERSTQLQSLEISSSLNLNTTSQTATVAPFLAWRG